MNPKTRVLIVDNDVAMAKYLAAHLSRRNFEVTVASSEQEALRIFRSFDPVLVLVETSMDGEAGNETLQRLKQIKPTVSIMVLSSIKDPELIFRASKLGADDYITKPVDPKDLDIRIGKVLDNQRLFTEVTQLREQVRRQSDFTMLFGTSPKMMEVKMTIEQVADTTATVLIRGESGTGK
jgi:DNA-binding NtrC family response regulator